MSKRDRVRVELSTGTFLIGEFDTEAISDLIESAYNGSFVLFPFVVTDEFSERPTRHYLNPAHIVRTTEL